MKQTLNKTFKIKDLRDLRYFLSLEVVSVRLYRGGFTGENNTNEI